MAYLPKRWFQFPRTLITNSKGAEVHFALSSSFPSGTRHANLRITSNRGGARTFSGSLKAITLNRKLCSFVKALNWLRIDNDISYGRIDSILHKNQLELRIIILCACQKHACFIFKLMCGRVVRYIPLFNFSSFNIGVVDFCACTGA